MVTPTTQLYGALEDAFAHFNHELFDDRLPPVIFTLHNPGSKVAGYFSRKNYKGRRSRTSMDEIALNPLFFNLPLEDILAHLVHQMTHCWQFEQGTASRPTYHNVLWATKMKEVGLQPSDTGRVGGLETGQTMDQFVIPGGLFQKACQLLLKTGFDVHWAEALLGRGSIPGDGSKVKVRRANWTCPRCGLNAMAKPSAYLICGTCSEDMVLRLKE